VGDCLHGSGSLSARAAWRVAAWPRFTGSDASLALENREHGLGVGVRALHGTATDDMGRNYAPTTATDHDERRRNDIWPTASELARPAVLAACPCGASRRTGEARGAACSLQPHVSRVQRTNARTERLLARSNGGCGARVGRAPHRLGQCEIPASISGHVATTVAAATTILIAAAAVVCPHRTVCELADL